MSLYNLPLELLLQIVDQQDRHRNINALSRACRRFHSIIDPHLYKYNAVHGTSSAIRWASSKGNVTTLMRSLQYGGDINARGPPNQGLNALQLACVHGHLEIVRLLLDKGIRPDERDSATYRSLDYALLGRNEQVACFLVENGAQMATSYYPCNYNATYLHLAASLGFRLLVKLLLDKGADIASVDYRGDTPLHWAIRADHLCNFEAPKGISPICCPECRAGNEDEDRWRGILETVTILVEEGADVYGKRRRRSSPWSMAKKHADSRLVEILRKGSSRRSYAA